MPVCTHGSLERQCEICERDKRIAELEAALLALLRDHDRLEGNTTHIAATTDDEVRAARRLLGQTSGAVKLARKPKLIWVREPCPTCGATTGAEAEKLCAPKLHCPASGITDKDDYLIQVTDASLKACEQWELENT